MRLDQTKAKLIIDGQEYDVEIHDIRIDFPNGIGQGNDVSISGRFYPMGKPDRRAFWDPNTNQAFDYGKIEEQVMAQMADHPPCLTHDWKEHFLFSSSYHKCTICGEEKS